MDGLISAQLLHIFFLVVVDISCDQVLRSENSERLILTSKALSNLHYWDGHWVLESMIAQYLSYLC